MFNFKKKITKPFTHQALNSGVVLINLERLRCEPQLVSPEYLLKLRQQYDYVTNNDQVNVFINLKILWTAF